MLNEKPTLEIVSWRKFSKNSSKTIILFAPDIYDLKLC